LRPCHRSVSYRLAVALLEPPLSAVGRALGEQAIGRPDQQEEA